MRNVLLMVLAAMLPGLAAAQEKLTIAHGLAAPEWLVALAAHPATGYVMRTLVCAGFVLSAVEKLVRFPAAEANFSSYHGLKHARAWLCAYIVTALVAAALVIPGRAVWLGAGMLVVFTGVATVIAFPFWKASGPARQGQVFAFREHLNLMAALFVVGWQDLLVR
jgi:transmembrane protein